MSSILEWLETPVIVVSAADGEKKNAMTAAWVTQVSFAPTLLAVSIAPERYTHGLIERAGAFAVNVLREGQQDLAREFGFKTGARLDKLAGHRIRTAKTGAPILEETGAFYDCKLVTRFTAGDHTIFIGEVVEEGLLEGGPFLPFRVKEYF